MLTSGETYRNYGVNLTSVMDRALRSANNYFTADKLPRSTSTHVRPPLITTKRDVTTDINQRTIILQLIIFRIYERIFISTVLILFLVLHKLTILLEIPITRVLSKFLQKGNNRWRCCPLKHLILLYYKCY